jgi:Flp pilus assembly protein TadD
LLSDRICGSNRVKVMTAFLPLDSKTRPARRLTSLAVTILVAAGAAGCGTLQQAGLTTGATAAPSQATPATPADPRQAMELWGERYRANPRDATAAVNYAQALRQIGQRAQAVAVLEQASIHNTGSMELAGAYGRALADVGKHEQALQVLNRAHTPDRPDWRILNVTGVVLDQLGRHDEAQQHYAAALRLMPEEPTILSNLGLSYVLAKNLPEAEATLKRAAAGRTNDSRVRGNLALVVGLQGRFAEAEAIARADLPPDQAAANVAYLREMIARQSAQGRPQPKRGGLGGPSS